MNLNEIDDLLRSAIKEDMPYGDITTESIIGENHASSAKLISKSAGILSGTMPFERVFKILGDVEIEFFKKDGDELKPGELTGILKGNTRNILSGERIALNILQRMSGIATETNKVVRMVSHTKCKILDTRKTTPNFRIFEKAAVLSGGGTNHRHCLSDGILIKDNHILAAGGISKAVEMARKNASFVHKIEVETENIQMVEEALSVKADIIMLDNMSIEIMKEAVRIIDGKALVEASGNITTENVVQIAETGVDYVSMGSIIYNSDVLDVSLKFFQ
ncbi:carboxylating nicotinate-nucleotide diphosphorylase [Alkalibacter mobilis]|uniref:carboxylating nicotinate-nucleotide diphosphorylase n=1 Tax=Alkalibacter mobilis TaxID=2787712 RepID=UPI00189D4859|nr:carboxylating nicotinate-nucleotide diphosphorylase [Alkalibacter mobilis]MBF7097484.1 carboxylating nicotinate-nucleotide diphosphorylase [Alkalibacter mobilis]